MGKQAIQFSTVCAGDVPLGRTASNRRGMTRLSLFLLGRMQTLHGTRTVRLHDVSRWGSMVEGAPLTVKIGSEAILKCDQLDVFATVRWVHGDRCGIKFCAPVGESTLAALQATSERLTSGPAPPRPR